MVNTEKMRLHMFVLVICTYTSTAKPTSRSTTESAPTVGFAGPSFVHPGVEQEIGGRPKGNHHRNPGEIPVIRLENGHISAETLEELDRLRKSHNSKDDSFHEGRQEDKIIRGELAYIHLIHDLAKQDEDLIEKDGKDALPFMEAMGKSIKDATDAASKSTTNGRKRYVLKDEGIRWEKCIIPFQWGDGFDGQEFVADAMEVIQNYTGVRFVEYNDGVPDLYGLSHRNRLNFINGDGCWSYIGNVADEGQDISCCSGSTCVHEIGHAMGFMHEQTSPLRDDHIRVEFDGISPRMWSQYSRLEKEDSLTFGYYDMTSVMHYYTWGFSINYKDTMTSLDPDLLYLIERDLDYYYFFSEVENSHNCLDQFCPNNKPICENDGYASVIHGQCACRCPEGLDPITGCTTVSTSCGGIYELTGTDPYCVILSPVGDDPNAYPTNEECVFFFQSPEGSTMQLDFPQFEIDCSDYVEIRNNLPGQPGTRFCGNGFDESIDSNFNYLSLRFKSDGSLTGKGFQATVRLITDEKSCYSGTGKDYSYVGKVNYTRSQQPCLKWNEVPNCRFNRFSNSELDDDLDNNYCRNAGVGTAPWCYTDAETCAREYCDACGNNKCYDIFDDCAQLIQEDAQFCETNQDGQAHRGCRKSCNKCVFPQPTGASVRCPLPEPIPTAYAPEPQKTAYRLGDQVEYRCLHSEDTRNRTCTSGGTWSELGFVCGACPRGWAHVHGKCFLWVDEALNHDDAVKRCQNLKSGSTLAMPQTHEETDVMRQIIEIDVEETRYTWIGLKQVGTEYVWADGSPLNWINWKNEPKGKDCVFIHTEGTWVDTNCRNERSIVCEYRPGPRIECVDQISNCDNLIEATPTLCVNQLEFAWANCPLSCGICSDEISLGKKREHNRSFRQIDFTAATDSSTSPTTGSVTPPTSGSSTSSVSFTTPIISFTGRSSTSPTTGSITPPTSSFPTATVSDIFKTSTVASRSAGQTSSPIPITTSPTTGSVTPPTSSVSPASRSTGSTSGSPSFSTSLTPTSTVSPASRSTGPASGSLSFSTSPTTGSVTPSTSSVSPASRSTGSTSGSPSFSTSSTTGSVSPPTSSESPASRSTGLTSGYPSVSTSPTTDSVIPPTSSVSTASRGTGSTSGSPSFSTSPTTDFVTQQTSSASTAGAPSFSTSPTTGSVTPPTSRASLASRSTGSTAGTPSFSTSPTTGSITPPPSSAFPASRYTGSTLGSPSFSTSPTTGSFTPPTASVSPASRSIGSTSGSPSFSTSPTTGTAMPPTTDVSITSRATSRTSRSPSFSTSPTTGSVTPPTSIVSTSSRATGQTSGSPFISTSPTTGSVTPPTSSALTTSRATESTSGSSSFSTSPTTGSVTPPTSSVSTVSRATESTSGYPFFSTSPTTGSVTPLTSSVSIASRATESTSGSPSFSTSPTTGSVTPPTSSASPASRSAESTSGSPSFSTSPTTGSVTPPTAIVSTTSIATGRTSSPHSFSTSLTTGSVTPPTSSTSTASRATGRTSSPNSFSTSNTTGSVTPPTASASTASRATGRTSSSNSFSTSQTTGSFTPPISSASTASKSTGQTSNPNSFSTSPTTGSVTPPTSSASTASKATGWTSSPNTSSTSPTTGSVTPPTLRTSSASRATGHTSSPNSFSTSPTTGSVTPPTSSAATASKATGQTSNPNSFSTSPTTGSVTPPTSSTSTTSTATGQTSRPNSFGTTSLTSPTSSFSTSTTSSTESSTTTVVSTSSTLTSTTPSPRKACISPSTPANAIVIRGADSMEIPTGLTIEYKCMEGFALAEGNLIRACLKSGELTGRSPVCKDRSLVPEPVNTVNIRRRDQTPSEGFSYLSTNHDFAIEKAGNISTWKFYSTINGSISLQVWRPTGKDKRFTLVGQNTVSASLTDRVRKVRVPATEQISVEVGDVLGIFLPRSGYGHVPYTLCSLAYQPEQGMQYISKKSKETATKWKVGKDYAFRGDTGSCKTWSLNAYI